MVGSALIRLLKEDGYTNIVIAARDIVDLRNQTMVNVFFKQHKPEYVFLSAARVGGIAANSAYPVEFLYDNLMIQNNMFKAAHDNGVTKFCFLGSSCIYPKTCPQPMKEEYLLTGPLEQTNEGYALAKIAGLKMAEYYHRQYGMQSICPIPCNLYGTNDHFDLQNSHVLSTLVRKFVDAVDKDKKFVSVWGTGIARREFMHVDDLALAVVLLMDNWHTPEIINVGWGIDLTIKELAECIAQQVGFTGTLRWDTTKPDGMLKKCLDTSKITALGFKPRISLSEGIAQTIREYRSLKTQKRNTHI